MGILLTHKINFTNMTQGRLLINLSPFLHAKYCMSLPSEPLIILSSLHNFRELASWFLGKVLHKTANSTFLTINHSSALY